MSESLQYVLLVEDDEDMIDIIVTTLDFVRVVVARTVKEAEEAFGMYEFAAIIMDGHVKGAEPITLRLVRKMNFLKPGLKIIATTGDVCLLPQLMAAGCSESCDKAVVAERLKGLLIRAA